MHYWLLYLAQLFLARAALNLSLNKNRLMGFQQTKTVNQTDNYHGTIVADPYRWLENLNSDEVEQWVNRQNTFSTPYLQKLPAYSDLKQRLNRALELQKNRHAVSIRKPVFLFCQRWTAKPGHSLHNDRLRECSGNIH